jgi:aminopeptidase
MTDPRIERLGKLLVDYSLELGERQILRIDAPDVAAPLGLALYRAALDAGAFPYTNLTVDGLLEILLEEGSEEQLAYVSPLQWHEIETIDALATIWSESNTKSLSRVDPGRHARFLGAQRQLSNRRWERISGGEMRWCGTLFPSHAHAQDAEMPLERYEDCVDGA